jgi:hypothetical protein
MISCKKLLAGLMVSVLLISALQGCSRSIKSDRDEYESEDRKRSEHYVDRNDDDDKNDNDDGETEKDKKGEEEKNKKSGIDEEYEWLIGSWMYSDSSGSVGFACIYEFKEDGTFSKALGTISGSSRFATGFDGNFKISDDRLILYNQLKSEAQASSRYDDLWIMKIAETLIKDIPVDDEEKPFRKTDEGNLVIDDTVYQKIDF